MRQIDHEKIITQYILLKSTPKYLDEQATRKCPVSIYDDAELEMISSDSETVVTMTVRFVVGNKLCIV